MLPPTAAVAPFTGCRLRALSLVLLLLLAACRSRSATHDGGPPADSARPLAPKSSAAPRCRPIPGASLVLGTAHGKAPVLDDAHEDAEIELPFSVELGAAHSAASGFALGGIESRAGANHAFVAWLDASRGLGKSVELGRIFGDVEPPVVTVQGDRWLVALADSDAAGGVLRVLSLAAPFTADSVVRGAEITGVRRDASGFALAASESGALLAWTLVEKGAPRLAVAGIEPATAKLRGAPRLLPVSPLGEPEAPRLVPRPGGYFLTYIVRGSAHEPRLQAPVQGVETLMEEGPSAIEIVPLDAAGQPLSAARGLTPRDARVIAFDLASTPAGGVLLIYRNEPGGKGLDPPDLQVVLTRADGTVEQRTWEVGDSAGLPSILRDPAPPSHTAWGFISVPGEQGTRLSVLGEDPLAAPDFLQDQSFRTGELMGVLKGRLLLAHARGTQRDLGLLECTPGTQKRP
ncbi:MAG TPA: hypothetical protein VER33_26395 [Polyangiaceae bacterium]|nr:hypothetical protein [Polyangiaceae bacterium]